ncbi:unnamed protein product [Ranitomeya imitator]|uniref:HotDog ACOT-type domain-containing protein n=1 Tax=Ranitomeya imitator TaxID=111125 RepID=A0ABN9KVS8_9NEOB|nr:unnamed protein product [Ranitomeya imitator]
MRGRKRQQLVLCLWLFSDSVRDHVQAMEERKALQSLLAKKQEDLPPRRMKDSYIEVMLPLGSEPQLREKYLNVYNNVRFGRILEDLDSLGVLICYTHTKSASRNMSPLSIVTALVDKIDLRKQIMSPDCDIKFTGHVSWVGKTSMEVKMHMLQLHDGIYSPVLDATFVMVARDPENRRPAFVNPIVPDGPEEERLLQQGELNKLRRIEFSTTSLLKMAPTAEERKIAHDIFLNTLDTNTVSFRSRILPPNSVWMEDAKLKGLEICHPQSLSVAEMRTSISSLDVSFLFRTIDIMRCSFPSITCHKEDVINVTMMASDMLFEQFLRVDVIILKMAHVRICVSPDKASYFSVNVKCGVSRDNSIGVGVRELALDLIGIHAPTHPLERSLNRLDLVRAVRISLASTAAFRKMDSLFAIPNGVRRGLPASKATVARSIRTAILEAYRVKNRGPPPEMKAHSTRAVGASSAVRHRAFADGFAKRQPGLPSTRFAELRRTPAWAEGSCRRQWKETSSTEFSVVF